MKKSSTDPQQLYVSRQLPGPQSFNALNWLKDGTLTKKYYSPEKDLYRSDESRRGSEIKISECIVTILRD
jgi:hypothetical protein